MVELRNLIAAEWLKLYRRPMAWILLATFLGLLILYLATWGLVVMLHEGTLSGGTSRIMLLADPQVDELKRQLSFPGIFGAVLGQVNSTGGICAIILAAGFVGSEYGWGTFRLLLTRAPRRDTYLVAKLLTLLLALAAAVGVALLLGSMIAAVAQVSLGIPGNLRLRDLLVLPLGIARSLLVILPYVMLAVTSAIFGRSVLAGVGGGLMFLALDMSAGSINTLAGVDPLVQMLVNLLLQPNINTLIVLNSQLFGLDQTVLVQGLDLSRLPSPLHATLVILVYCGFFFWTAYRLLLRRDVAGAV